MSDKNLKVVELVEYDYLIKLIAVGDSGVGKSSLVHRFAIGGFNLNHVSTIGVDFEIREFEVDGKIVKLQCWDSAGNERFRSITRSYYNGAHLIMIVFDVTDPLSIDSISSWITETKQFNNLAKIMIVGNKIDKQPNFIIPTELKQLVNEIGANIILTSAKENQNVQEAFIQLTKTYIQQQLSNPINNKKQTINIINPNPQTNQNKLSCCK